MIKSRYGKTRLCGTTGIILADFGSITNALYKYLTNTHGEEKAAEYLKIFYGSSLTTDEGERKELLKRLCEMYTEKYGKLEI